MECGFGLRFFYVWRSIIYGRELIIKGMVMKFGDGKEIKVWIDNWIIDFLFRLATYFSDVDVDFTLCVDEFLFLNIEFWDV